MIRSVLAAWACVAASASAQTPADFRRDVLPILKEACFGCHLGQRASSGVRLDAKLDVLGETTGRPLVVPRDPDASRLIQRLLATEPARRMPKDSEPLAPEKIAILKAWVREGMAWDETLFPSTSPPPEHWAYRPIARPAVPKATGRTPVDAFVSARLEAEGVAPAPEADRRTLLRRLTLDLTGLPPSAEDVERFERDAAPDAYERAVERLLASPAYGERWGRHWLDVARWAESEGYESNHLRLHAWRYRDWVVRAFQEDMPFADFVRAQLAGDETFPYRDEHLVATGFLASARLSSNEEDRARQRNDLLVDVVNATSTAFLGVTVQCAQCHNHKFDPISARDYYRLQAFFVRGQPANVALRDADLKRQYDAQKPAEYDDAVRERDALFAKAKSRKVAETRRGLSAEALYVYDRLAMDQRTPAQERLARETDLRFQYTAGQVERMLEPDERARYDALKKRVADWEKTMTERPQTFAFVSPATSPHAFDVLPMKGFYPLELDVGFLRRNRAYLLATGDVHQPAFPVTPGVPGFLGAVSGTSRLDLADWIASPKNPLAARVWANRVWQLHFGRGLCATPADFGVKGATPTHPELLDWLASEFLASGGSTRRLHRLIVHSAAYRRSATALPESQAKDPDNTLYHRWRPRRLEAEAIRDGLLAVAGDLDVRVGGASVPADEKQTRRSLYVFQKREAPPAAQALFDGPAAMTEACVERRVTTVPLQPLYLLNGEFATARARALAERIRAEAASDDPGAAVDAGYRRVLQRRPTPRERALAIDFLASTPSDRALFLFAQTLLNLNELAYLE